MQVPLPPHWSDGVIPVWFFFDVFDSRTTGLAWLGRFMMFLSPFLNCGIEVLPRPVKNEALSLASAF
jgi:hypothetical protein